MEETKHGFEHMKHEHLPVKRDKKVVIAVIVLGLLLVFSVAQTIQLVTMKGKLQNEVTLGSAPLAGKQASSTGSGDLKSNIQNLPGMVGGC